MAEPSTGVAVLTAEGCIEMANPQVVEIYFGGRYTPEQLKGRAFDELLPKAFCDERRRAFRQVLDSGRPLLMRSIWRGFQQHAWMHPVQHDFVSCSLPGVDAEPVDDDATPSEIFNGILLVTRRVADGAQPESDDPSGFEYREATYIDLGPLSSLTPRELEVLALLGQGLSVPDAARVLRRSPKTVQTHRDHINQKLQSQSRAELVKIANRAGLTLDDAARVDVGEM